MANQGYYKQSENEVIHAPNRVVTPSGTLLRAIDHLPQNDPSFPIEGWYWFDSVEEAFKFLNVNFVFETPTQVSERLEASIYPKLVSLRNMTPTQIQNFVDNNVTTLAQAKDAIKTLAIAVGILARRL